MAAGDERAAEDINTHTQSLLYIMDHVGTENTLECNSFVF